MTKALKRQRGEKLSYTFKERFDLERVKELSKIKDFSFLTENAQTTGETTQNTKNKIKYQPGYIRNLLKDEELNKSGFITTKVMQKDIGWGRYYYTDKNYGALYLKNALRGYILPQGTLDVDMVKCHPTILMHLFDELKIQCDPLREFLANPDEFFVENNISKDDLLRVLNFARFQSPNQKLTAINEAIYFSLVPILRKLDQYKELDQLIRSKKRDNSAGIFISYVLQDIEQDCMYFVMKFLEQKGIEHGCLIYDGIHVYPEGASMLDCDELSTHVSEQMGFTVKFKVKNFPQPKSLLEKVEEHRDSPSKESSAELDMAKAICQANDHKIKYYGTQVFLKDFDHKWCSDEGHVKNIFFRWILDTSKTYPVNKWENTFKCFKAFISVAYNDTDLLNKFDRTTKHILCFKNGFLNLATKQFVLWTSTEANEIYTDVMINYNYEPSTLDEREELLDLIIRPIFNNDEKLITEFMAYISRALGMNRDKYWLTAEGERDSGKSLLMKVFSDTFEDYVFQFSSSNLIYSGKDEAEERNTWLHSFTKGRVGFSSETKTKQKLDGTKIKSISSGNDKVQIKLMRENAGLFAIRANFVMLQQEIPDVEPLDATMNMLSFRFPCYFAAEKRENEFAVFKVADPDIKSKFDSNEGFKCALVDLIMEWYPLDVPKYELMKRETAEMVADNVDEDNDQIIPKLFHFTKNESDKLTYKQITEVVKMGAKKIKSRFEKYGARYMNDRSGTHYTGVKVREKESHF